MPPPKPSRPAPWRLQHGTLARGGKVQIEGVLDIQFEVDPQGWRIEVGDALAQVKIASRANSEVETAAIHALFHPQRRRHGQSEAHAQCIDGILMNITRLALAPA